MKKLKIIQTKKNKLILGFLFFLLNLIVITPFLIFFVFNLKEKTTQIISPLFTKINNKRKNDSQKPFLKIDSKINDSYKSFFADLQKINPEWNKLFNNKLILNPLKKEIYFKTKSLNLNLFLPTLTSSKKITYNQLLSILLQLKNNKQKEFTHDFSFKSDYQEGSSKDFKGFLKIGPKKYQNIDKLKNFINFIYNLINSFTKNYETPTTDLFEENFILTKQNIHDLKSELENLIHFKRKENILRTKTQNLLSNLNKSLEKIKDNQKTKKEIEKTKKEIEILLQEKKWNELEKKIDELEKKIDELTIENIFAPILKTANKSNFIFYIKNINKKNIDQKKYLNLLKNKDALFIKASELLEVDQKIYKEEWEKNTDKNKENFADYLENTKVDLKTHSLTLAKIIERTENEIKLKIKSNQTNECKSILARGGSSFYKYKVILNCLEIKFNPETNAEISYEKLIEFSYKLLNFFYSKIDKTKFNNLIISPENFGEIINFYQNKKNYDESKKVFGNITNYLIKKMKFQFQFWDKNKTTGEFEFQKICLVKYPIHKKKIAKFIACKNKNKYKDEEKHTIYNNSSLLDIINLSEDKKDINIQVCRNFSVFFWNKSQCEKKEWYHHKQSNVNVFLNTQNVIQKVIEEKLSEKISSVLQKQFPKAIIFYQKFLNFKNDIQEFLISFKEMLQNPKDALSNLDVFSSKVKKLFETEGIKKILKNELPDWKNFMLNIKKIMLNFLLLLQKTTIIKKQTIIQFIAFIKKNQKQLNAFFIDKNKKNNINWVWDQFQNNSFHISKRTKGNKKLLILKIIDNESNKHTFVLQNKKQKQQVVFYQNFWSENDLLIFLNNNE